MNNRLMKYSLAAGLALLLALPAVAYSQYEGPQGPRFGAGGGGPGNFAEMGEMGPQRGRDSRRSSAGPRDRGDFGRAGRAGVGGHGGRGGRSSLAARALAQADQIGLSTEQREQILAAQRSVREASINRRAESQIAGLDLRDLMSADTPDIAAVEIKLRELAEQRIAEQVGALRLGEAVGEVLTAEQIDKLGDLSRDRGRSRSNRGSGRRPRNNAR